jgi:hypothetical protein
MEKRLEWASEESPVSTRADIIRLVGGEAFYLQRCPLSCRFRLLDSCHDRWRRRHQAGGRF